MKGVEACRGSTKPWGGRRETPGEKVKSSRNRSAATSRTGMNPFADVAICAKTSFPPVGIAACVGEAIGQSNVLPVKR